MKTITTHTIYIFFCVIFATLFAQSGALAGEAQQHLQKLLSGNSIHGEWAGAAYKQYFNPNGETIYQEQNRRPSLGRWRISDECQYCSTWPPATKEACYEVTLENEKMMWHSGENRYPSTVVPGRQI